MSNIHLLTGVSSFARWPLNLHFFAREAQTAWENWTRSAETPVREGLGILTDFKPTGNDAEHSSKPTWGIHNLPLDYKPMKEYVEKVHNVVSFEREGKCVHCKQELVTGKGLYAMCPNQGCEAMGHLDCWSRHALSTDREGIVMPHMCRCPSCEGEIRWGDMVKELSLRTRGVKEVEKLLKKKKSRAKSPE